MAEDKKQSMMRRVRALLKKTEEAGCTEAEAQQAAELARSLIEQYQLEMTEEQLIEEGFLKAKKLWTSQEDALIANYICRAIGMFTGARIWRAEGVTQQRQDRHFFGL